MSGLRTLAARRSVEWMRVAALAALLVFAAPALAGEPAAPKPSPAPRATGTPPPAPVSTPEMISGMEGRKPTDVLRFETLVIEGRVQTPEAVHLEERSDVDFIGLLPRESLLPRILDAVESEPF